MSIQGQQDSANPSWSEPQHAASRAPFWIRSVDKIVRLFQADGCQNDEDFNMYGNKTKAEARFGLSPDPPQYSLTVSWA